MTEVIRKADLLVSVDRTPIDRTFFNKRFAAIADGINGIGARQDTYDVAVSQLVTLGLQRINDVLGPFLLKLQEAADLGFLVCKSDGVSHSLVSGAAIGFVVTEGAELFTPTPYLLVQDNTDPFNWGLVSLDEGGWTPSTGDLATHCVYASVNQASSSWTISCNSALYDILADVLVDSVAAKDAAEAAVTTITTAMGDLQSLIDAISEGPVASVAGRTGVITLALADVVGLIDALTAKAATSWVTTQLAGKQPSSALLSVIAALSFTADMTVYSTSSSAITTTALTAWARTLLAAVDQAAAQAIFGFGTAATHAEEDFAVAANYLKRDETAAISVGYTLTPYDNGIKSSGTFTPAAANGNYQFYTNNGAHTLAAPAADCAIDILVTNGATAGTITFSGFTVGTNKGDALTNTNAHKFILSILRINGTTTYNVKALQ